MLSKAWKHLTINLCRKKLVPLHVELRSRSFFSTSHLLLAQRKIHKQSLWNCWQTGNISDPIAVLIGQVINHAFNSVLVIWFQHIYKTPKLNSIQDQQATASRYTALKMTKIEQVTFVMWPIFKNTAFLKNADNKRSCHYTCKCLPVFSLFSSICISWNTLDDNPLHFQFMCCTENS